MKFLKRFFLAAFLVILILLEAAPHTARAQTSLTVQLSAVRASSFPEIVLYASVADQSGNRLSGLTEENFTILEDGNELTPQSVQEERLGTRQIYFINTSLASGLRDASGSTRLDYANLALLNWWQLPDASRIGLDDLSLYTSEAALAVHETSAAVLASRLSSFTPDFELETFPFQRMVQVLQAAEDPLPREGMTTSLIFVSPLVRAPELEDLEAAVEAAQGLDVRIHTVLLAEGEELESPIAAEMERLSIETGGTLVILDPETGLNDLARKVISQQSQYILRSSSMINISGGHTLSVAARTGSVSGISNPVDISIDVQPPEITFESLPAGILRQSDDPSVPLEEIAPTSQEVVVSVDFPDGFPRDIASISLLVNGEEVAVNYSPPFEQFDWDINSFTTDSELVLTARVEDSLGLTSESREQTVRITLDMPPTGLTALRPALSSFFLTLTSIFLAAAALIGIVMFIRRAAERPSRQIDPAQNGGNRLPAVSSRPLSQPVDEVPEAALISLEIEELTIPLIGIDHIIGSDAALATILLQDPAIDALHARLIRHADGKYLLKDTGSTAGTWVNYHQIPESGMILHHGDLIHFGRAGFRYMRRSPGRHHRPVVTDFLSSVSNGQQPRMEKTDDTNE